MDESVAPDETLDCRGLSCPMPLLKTKKAIAKLQSGQVLEIMSNDPGTGNDLPAFTVKAGHEFLGSKQQEGYTSFYIRVK